MSTTDANESRKDYRETSGRPLAQTTAAVIGITLVVIGILGFFLGGSNFNTGTAVQGEDLIIFEVNGWHNLVHIASGAFLLAMALRAPQAALGLIVFGVAYALVTVWGFIDGNTVLWLLPVDTADNWLHAALTVASLLIGFSTYRSGTRPRRQKPAHG